LNESNVTVEAVAQTINMGAHPLFHRRISYGMAINDSGRSTVSVDYSPIGYPKSDGMTMTLCYDRVKPAHEDTTLMVGRDFVYFEYFFDEKEISDVGARETYLAYMEDYSQLRLALVALVRAKFSIKDIISLLTQIGSQTHRLDLTKPDKPVLLVIDEHFVALGKLWTRHDLAMQALRDAFPGEITTYNGNEQDKIYWWFSYHHNGLKCIER
jgi:hypothetical protein